MAVRRRLENWREHLTSWSTFPVQDVICPGCGATRPPWHWDWKQQGGFGRQLIVVENVFPGEAVPTGSLLDLLHTASGIAWRYFYVQDFASGS